MVEVAATVGERGVEQRRPRELALSAAWHGGLARAVNTADGAAVEIVFRGVWTHGFGPDFRDAMLAFPAGELRTGAVEIHHCTSDWRAHGHHLDQRYNEVILHLVLDHDGAETRRADGALVPVALLPIAPETLRELDRRLPAIWEQLGGAVCAEELTRSQPARIRDALHHLGDRRLAERSARFEAELIAGPPAAALLRGLLDALGYAENRVPMRALADLLPVPALGSLLADPDPGERSVVALALLLGIGGFLPVAPADAAAARLSVQAAARVERRWADLGSAWHDRRLPPTAWQRARVRPANHPALRLAQGAALLANTRGEPLSSLLEPLRNGTSPAEHLIALTRDGDIPPIGADRAISTVASVLIPFALAYSEHTGDPILADSAAAAWESLPAATLSRPAKRARHQVAGSAPLSRLGERGQQGLLTLDRTLCTPRRCYECPIAHEVTLEGMKGA